MGTAAIERRGDPPSLKPRWRQLVEDASRAAAPVALLFAAATFTLSSLGFRVTGTPDDMRAVREDVRSVIQVNARQDTSIGEIRTTLRLVTYLGCVQIRRTDPTATPAECSRVIDVGR